MSAGRRIMVDIHLFVSALAHQPELFHYAAALSACRSLLHLEFNCRKQPFASSLDAESFEDGKEEPTPLTQLERRLVDPV